jgi:hypothetical protein
VRVSTWPGSPGELTWAVSGPIGIFGRASGSRGRKRHLTEILGHVHFMTLLTHFQLKLISVF